jgi:hypothetical protein
VQEQGGEAGEDRGGSVRGFVATHPWITALFAACALAGAVAGVLYLPEDWSLARRLAAGALAGTGSALLVTAPRLIG